MRKKAVVIIEAKEGYEWSWPQSERVWYQIRVEKIKGNYKIEKVGKVYRNGAGFEGVGGRKYTICRIKIYKDFVGKVIQIAEYPYSGYEEEEVLFDNIDEKKKEQLKEYLKTIKTAERLGKKLSCKLTIYFDSELFTLEEFFAFLEKEVGTHKIYPIDVQKEYEDLGFNYKVWRYKITCEAWNFVLKYNKSYYGKESYKKVDEILEKYGDLLRKRIKGVEVCQ